MLAFIFCQWLIKSMSLLARRLVEAKNCKKTSSMYTVHKAVNHKTTFSCRNCVLHFLRIVIYHDWKELEHEFKRVWSYMKNPVLLFACFHSTALCVNNVSNLVVVLTPSFVKDFTINENEIGFWTLYDAIIGLTW